MRLRRLGCALFVTLVCQLASGQEPISSLQRPSRPMIEAAQAHYQSGTRFFETAQFDAALVEFDAGTSRSRSTTRCVTKRRCRPTRIASVPASAPGPAPAPTKTEARTKTPPLALGLVAGGSALAAVGIGCLAGAWATGQQLGSADLAYSDAATLLDRGRTLNTTGIALTVVGGAAAVGGAITWAVLGGRTDKPTALAWK